MLGSHNHFFTQSAGMLASKRRDVHTLLCIKGYSLNEINVYLKAYDYFVQYKEQFDGATIVKDLCDLPKLDLDAMLHDYHYLYCNSASNFYTKIKSDWIYAKGQERKGKGSYSSFSRFILLLLVAVIFVPYTAIKRGKITNRQFKIIKNDYNTLMK